MYRVPDEKNGFFLYNVSDQTAQFIKSRKELVLLLSQGFEIRELCYVYYLVNKYYQRNEYELYDGVGRPLNAEEEFKFEVIDAFEEQNGFPPERILRQFFYENRRRLLKPSSKFRREPVPGVHRKKSYARYFRNIKYKHYAADKNNPEYKPFKRGNSFNSWDAEKYKSIDKSWKRQSKRRHQWKNKGNI